METKEIITMNSFKFIKVREVASPSRNNSGDAGLDFYVPTDLKLADMINANSRTKYSEKALITSGSFGVIMSGPNIQSIILGSNTRIIIPSGIKGLLEPKNSMLQVNNKTGKSTKDGLIYTAQVVDSGYRGEIHLCVYNTNSLPVTIECGKPLIQLIHVPVFLTEPEEITEEEFNKSNDTERGEKWQGSGDDRVVTETV